MAYKRIVLATDGSPSAETAEQVAAAFAVATKGSLTIAHAYASRERAEAAVERALRLAEREGVTETQVVLSADDPADAVIRTAEEIDADAIVMGSRGLYQAEQLIGSVLRKVVTHAPCDVLLTRTRPDEERPRGTAALPAGPGRHGRIGHGRPSGPQGVLPREAARRLGYPAVRRARAGPGS